MNTSNRKNEHVTLAEKFYSNMRISDFDLIHYIHHSFPEINVTDIDTTTTIASFTLSTPFFINAMTGGNDFTKKINEKLATVARETGLLMASGSLSAALKHSFVEDSFTIIRKTNPNGLVFANIGCERPVEDVKRAINIINADAIQIHINAPQELIMTEGDRQFSNWLSNIETIAKEVDVPVIVKEVGFGMSSETINQLISIGVKVIDVSGKGGTNFAQIENYRSGEHYDFLENWGQSTVVSLLEAQKHMKDVEIIASGGIRNPLDVIKSLSLGAKAVGVSRFFLHKVLNEGIEETINEINLWKEQIALLMTLLGKRSNQDLEQTDLRLTGDLVEWCIARNLDYRQFACRSNVTPIL